MELQNKNCCLAIIFMVYGVFLMATTFMYYTNLTSNEKIATQCDFVKVSSGSEFDFQIDEKTCCRLGTWISCSIAGFMAGLLVVAAAMYSFTANKNQSQGSFQDSERLTCFYSTLVIGAGILCTIIAIILIDSKAIEFHAENNFPQSFQSFAFVTLGLLLLPSLLVILFTAVIAAMKVGKFIWELFTGFREVPRFKPTVMV